MISLLELTFFWTGIVLQLRLSLGERGCLHSKLVDSAKLKKYMFL
jgi:hypothetical protein